MIHSLSVVSYQKLRQVVTPKPVMLTVSSKLTNLQTIKHNIRTRAVKQNLSLKQAVTCQRSIANLSVGNGLFLSQVVAKDPKYLQVVQHFFCYQDIRQPKTGDVAHNVALVQGIHVDKCAPIINTLALGQAIICNVVRNITVVSEHGLIDGANIWKTNPDFNLLNPVFTIQEKVRFKFGTDEFYIRKPNFDDTYIYEFTRINRRTRGGDLIIARNPIWPKDKKFKLAFSHLNDQDIAKLINLCKISLGRKVRYLNYDSVEWEGYITNPQSEAVQPGRYNRTFSVEFQGEPL